MYEWVDHDGRGHVTADRPNRCETPLAVRIVATPQDRDPEACRKIVPVTDDLMSTPEVMLNKAVMIHASCREGRMSHNTAHRAADGRWYIRKGKRGGAVRYLTQCEVLYLDGVPTLYQFKTDYLD